MTSRETKVALLHTSNSKIRNTCEVIKQKSQANMKEVTILKRVLITSFIIFKVNKQFLKLSMKLSTIVHLPLQTI